MDFDSFRTLDLKRYEFLWFEFNCDFSLEKFNKTTWLQTDFSNE